MESIPPTVKHLVKFVNLGVLALTSRKKNNCNNEA